MKARLVKTSFWSNPAIEELSPEGKYIFLYCITNPHIGLTGAYRCSINRVSYETGYPIDTLSIGFQELEEKGFLAHKDGWVVVFNTEKHNNYSLGAKTKIAYQKEYLELPKWVKDRVSIPPENIKQKPETIKQKTENRKPAESKPKETDNTLKRSLVDELPTEEDIIHAAKKKQVSAKTVRKYKKDYLDWINTKPGDKSRWGRSMLASVYSWIQRDLDDGKLQQLPDQMVEYYEKSGRWG